MVQFDEKIVRREGGGGNSVGKVIFIEWPKFSKKIATTKTNLFVLEIFFKTCLGSKKMVSETGWGPSGPL